MQLQISQSECNRGTGSEDCFPRRGVHSSVKNMEEDAEVEWGTKLDTGVDMMAISATVYTEKEHGILTRATKGLRRLRTSLIAARGQFNGIIATKLMRNSN